MRRYLKVFQEFSTKFSVFQSPPDRVRLVPGIFLQLVEQKISVIVHYPFVAFHCKWLSFLQIEYGNLPTTIGDGGDKGMTTRCKDGSNGTVARGPFCNLYRLCKLCLRWPEDDGNMILVAMWSQCKGGDESNTAISLALVAWWHDDFGCFVVFTIWVYCNDLTQTRGNFKVDNEGRL